MNERYEQLFAQAWIEFAPGHKAVLERFAELIVRECIDKCEFVANMATITNAGEMACKTKATADSCDIMIKEHFGVEE